MSSDKSAGLLLGCFIGWVGSGVENSLFFKVGWEQLLSWIRSMRALLLSDNERDGGGHSWRALVVSQTLSHV